MTERQVMLYGISDASKQYICIKWFCVYEQDITINNIVMQARLMKIKNPSIEHVYAVDNRHGLKRDYTDSIKKNSIESCAIFKDILETEGLRII